MKKIEIEKQNIIIRQYDPSENMDEIITELIEFIEENNLTITGHLFARNYKENNEIKYEFGIPIEEYINGNDEIKVLTIPEHTAIRTLHKGPYNRIIETVDKLSNYLNENNLKLTDAPIYIYQNSPKEVAEDELITEVQYPIS